MTTEPVVKVASVTAAVTAVLTLLVTFGVPLSTDQQAAILGVVAVLAPLVVVYARRYVSPALEVADDSDVDEDDDVTDTH